MYTSGGVRSTPPHGTSGVPEKISGGKILWAGISSSLDLYPKNRMAQVKGPAKMSFPGVNVSGKIVVLPPPGLMAGF
jgi:hypothetical protein